MKKLLVLALLVVMLVIDIISVKAGYLRRIFVKISKIVPFDIISIKTCGTELHK